MRYSEVLRAMAEAKNLTQKRIATDLGIPPSTIGGYFQGTSEPDLETIKRLAIYFDCSIDLLAGNAFSSKYTQDEELLLFIFRSMNPSQQKLFSEIGKTILKSQPEG